jgi:formylmethanofuran:tetrahydromethanopterin formyltransferase
MTGDHYPSRSFIRFAAKSQLTADLAGHSVPVYVDRNGLDEFNTVEPCPDSAGEVGAYCEVFEAKADSINDSLFQRVTQELLNPDQHPEIYRSYPSRAAAAAVEAKATSFLVERYKQVCLAQRQTLVQQFNALLTH